MPGTLGNEDPERWPHSRLASIYCCPLSGHCLMPSLSEGTGGTLQAQFLKSMAGGILMALMDPEGSRLYNKVSRVAAPILY